MTELETKLTDKELLSCLLSYAYDVEFWSENGTYKDGKYEEAKADLKRVKKLVLERMELGRK